MKSNLNRSCFRLAVGLFAACLAIGAQAQVTVRASVADNEAQANEDTSQASIGGANGRYVAFSSRATNLVPGGTTGYQVFVRDLVSNTTTLASVNTAGQQANASCTNPRISTDGRFVVFSSDADNLVPFDSNGTRDVFVRDLSLPGSTTRVSVGDDESEGNGVSDSSSISSDGNMIVFRSSAQNLVPGGTTGFQVFLRNVALGETTLVSKSDLGVQGDADSGLFQTTITPDGRYVGFSSMAGNLVVNDALNTLDTNANWDVYVRDMQFGTMRRISLAINGSQGFNWSHSCSMSDDGRYVAFVSPNGFVNGDTNGTSDVFLRDMVANTMTRISVDSQGKQANGSSGNEEGWGVRISGNGMKVAFSSLATNLIKGDTNGAQDVFVRDRATNKTTMISVTAAGKPANGFSYTPTISADGQYVAFISRATNVVSGDTNGFWDAFVRGPAR